MPRGAVVGLVIGLVLGAAAWLLLVYGANTIWPTVLGGLAWMAVGAGIGSIVGALVAAGASNRGAGAVADTEPDERDDVPTKPAVPGPIS